MVLKVLIILTRFALYLFELALVIYTLYPFFSKVRSTFYQTVARICEPVLIPIRRFLLRHLPKKWQRIDLSPLAAIILCGIAVMILNGLSLLL